jgi:hypothetical protein
MAKNEAKKTNGAESSTDSSLPLFFKRPVPLDAVRHAEAGIVSQTSMEFAKDTNSVFINAIEFAEAAKFYPIIFSAGEQPMPAVLTGFEQENYYIGKDGAWKKDVYVPAYVRRYPFVFMDVPKEDKLVLCIDEGAPHFREKGGKDVQPFYDNGEPSELSKNALNFCSAFQAQYHATRAFCAALQEAELFSPTRSDVKLANGREIQLSGFQVIDEKKFSTLTDEQIIDFHKKGWLPLLYFVLMSASNWRNLINLAAERE